MAPISAQDNSELDGTWDVQLKGTTPTYSAAAVFAPAASATDIFTLAGSASKTIRVTMVRISGIATTAITVSALLIKRTTANTGGTAAVVPSVAHDSSDAVATAVATSYTANPTALGTSAGNIRAEKVYFPLTTTVGAGVTEWVFGSRAKAPILRGTAQLLCVNLSATTVAGGSVCIEVEWVEE